MTVDEPAESAPSAGSGQPGIDAETLYQALVNHSADLTVFVFGPDLCHIRAGGVAFERFGWRSEDIVGRRPTDLLADDRGSQIEKHMQAALAGETRVFDHAALHDAAGFWRSTVVPVRDADGAVVAGMIISRDVAPALEAQRTQQESEERFEGALEAMLDSVTVQQPVRDATGTVVDFRISYATENAVDFAGRRRAELIDHTLRELFPELGDDFIAAYVHVLKTGQGVHFNAFPYPDADGNERMYDLAVSRIGDALLVTWREVTERERSRVLVARAAAVRSVSEQLQRGLLPAAPPEIPGVRFAATYHPALETAEVGGDWYDVVPRPSADAPSQVVDVIVGDVEGHDGHAAARMARYSTLVRAACCRCERVEAIVNELREFHTTFDNERLVTIAIARVDVATGEVVVVSAGHPPPVIRRATGEVQVADLSVDPPVGAPGESVAVGTLHLEPGATLVMFSDGLLDPRADPDDAYRTIATILSGVDPASPTELVSSLEDYARGHQPSDDVVVVAAHRCP
ncbi:MAG TPA: SpoIIE family protein phosphatase [Mycobacteriales bacterium]|jgi:PAS domain-containing protein|nr:SpoIIE family protein phosphatase [Mycobacteriales bacterium]